MKKHILAIIIIFCCGWGQLFSQSVFDFSFAGTGKIEVSGGALNNPSGNGIVIQPDGKIIIVGITEQQATGVDCFITRYNADGTIDNTFGTNGVTISPATNANVLDGLLFVLLQTDGKIVAIGVNNEGSDGDIVVIRYNANGMPDNTFGTNGIALIDFAGDYDTPDGAALQADGKIVIGCSVIIANESDMGIVRLNTNGTLDNTFSSDGKTTTDYLGLANGASGLAIQADGKIVCAGDVGTQDTTLVIVARFNTDGTLDTGFDGDGIRAATYSPNGVDVVTDVAIQTDGKIIVSALSSNTTVNYLLVRYNSNGSTDNTFGTAGVVSQSINAENRYLRQMLLQPDGKILVLGGDEFYDETHIARFNSNGTLDNTLNGDGHAEIDVNTGSDYMRAFALQADNKIVATGYDYNGQSSSLIITRFTPDLIVVGLIEFALVETAPLVYPNPLQATETLKYTLAANEQISITMIDAQGKLVSTFVENEAQQKGDHEATLSLSNIATGTYFIQISSPKGIVSIKVVK